MKIKSLKKKKKKIYRQSLYFIFSVSHESTEVIYYKYTILYKTIIRRPN